MSLESIARRVVRLVAGSVVVLRAATLPAQVAPSADSLGRWILPGDTLLRGTRLPVGTVRYQLTAYRDGDEFNVGRLQDELAVDTVNGSPVLRRVQLLQRGPQRILDSSRTELATLRPLWHRSEQPQRRIGLDFAGPKIKATVGMPEATPAVIDTTLQRPPFDSSNWDLVLRALPLTKGLRVRVLVYDTDAGAHEYRFAVGGTATILGEEAHIVTFTLSRTSEAMVWISTATHELLQMETMLAGNTLLRQVRLREPPRPPTGR